LTFRPRQPYSGLLIGSGVERHISDARTASAFRNNEQPTGRRAPQRVKHQEIAFMAVVPAEPYLFRCDLLNNQGSADPEQRWWALRTRPRAEKTLARQLHGRGVPFFLPLHERRRVLQRRLVRSFLPLFPGYLFIRGADEDRIESLKTNMVAQCLNVVDQEQFSESLRNIFSLMEAGAPLSPEERLQPGMQAEIVSGPLAGYRGTVVRSGSKLKFVIEVDFLQRGASVEIDSAMIRPI
jgi:transcriptional antiterminator RfaH